MCRCRRRRLSSGIRRVTVAVPVIVEVPVPVIVEVADEATAGLVQAESSLRRIADTTERTPHRNTPIERAPTYPGTTDPVERIVGSGELDGWCAFR
jgi:hypothetical protein